MVDNSVIGAGGAQPPEKRKRLGLSPEILAIMNMPGPVQAQAPTRREVLFEGRTERLRQRDDATQRAFADVMNAPRSSEIARRDAMNTPSPEAPPPENPSAKRPASADARQAPAAGAASNDTSRSAPASTSASRFVPSNGPISPAPVAATPTPSAENAVAGKATPSSPAGATAHARPALSPVTGLLSTSSAQIASAANVGTRVQGTPSTAAAAPARRVFAMPTASPSPTAGERVVTGEGRSAVDRASNLLRAQRAKETAEPDAEERTSDANLERVLRVLKLQLARDKSVATIRLDPPELGNLRVRMELQGSKLVLEVEAQRNVARDLLQKDSEFLRRGLEAAGIELTHMEVRSVEPSMPTEVLGGEPESFAQPPGGDGHGRTSPDGSERDGSQAAVSPPLESAGPDAAPEPATESLVNLWA